MTPHPRRGLFWGPWDCLVSLKAHKHLIKILVRQDLLSRYQGSALGLAWAMLTPLLMLGVYALVFGEILQVRWPGEQSGSALTFAASLFSGLTVLGFFADAVGRSPQLIVAQQNYVKRLVFPLHLLPLVAVCSSAILVVLGALVLLLFVGLGLGHWPLSFVALPLVLFPVALLAAGLSCFLSALGVYLRDISQVVGLALSALTFLSPVFYPLSAVPVQWRWLFALNPVAVPIEQLRLISVVGHWPDWYALGTATVLGFTVLWLGLAWFQRVRDGFADVL
jgi:lipopolysaccharide transport system permease protein